MEAANAHQFIFQPPKLNDYLANRRLAIIRVEIESEALALILEFLRHAEISTTSIPANGCGDLVSRTKNGRGRGLAITVVLQLGLGLEFITQRLPPFAQWTLMNDLCPKHETIIKQGATVNTDDNLSGIQYLRWVLGGHLQSTLSVLIGQLKKAAESQQNHHHQQQQHQQQHQQSQQPPQQQEANGTPPHVKALTDTLSVLKSLHSSSEEMQLSAALNLKQVIDQLAQSTRTFIPLYKNSPVVVAARAVFIQLNYDLGVFHFRKSDFTSSKNFFLEAQRHFKQTSAQMDITNEQNDVIVSGSKGTPAFWTASEESLNGYLTACGVDVPLKSELGQGILQSRALLRTLSVEDTNTEAVEKFRDLLRRDNGTLTLPLQYRQALAQSAPRSLRWSVLSINLIREMMNKEATNHNIWSHLTSHAQDKDVFAMMLKEIHTACFEDGDLPGKDAVLLLQIRSLVHRLTFRLQSLGVEYDIFQLLRSTVPEIAQETDNVNLTFSISQPPPLPEPSETIIAQLEKSSSSIIQSHLASTVALDHILAAVEILKKRNVYCCKAKCIGVCSCQVFSAEGQQLDPLLRLILFKARRCRQFNNNQASKELLTEVSKYKEANNNHTVHLELLLTLAQCFTERKLSTEENQLANKCIDALARSPVYVEREDLEFMLAYFLNSERWGAESAFLYSKWGSGSNGTLCKFAQALAAACDTVRNGQGNNAVKGLCVTIIQFLTSKVKVSSKRKRGIQDQQEPTTDTEMLEWDSLEGFLRKLSNRTVFMALIGAFSVAHNHVQPPGTRARMSIYDNDVVALFRPVAETLKIDEYLNGTEKEHIEVLIRQKLIELFQIAKSYRFFEPVFHLSLGDLLYFEKEYASSLVEYLKGLSGVSSCFYQPVPERYLGRRTFERMTSCLMSLKAYIQAAALCQYQKPTNYKQAFESVNLACGGDVLSKPAPSTYFPLIWDVSILEILVNLHWRLKDHATVEVLKDLIGRSEFHDNADVRTKTTAVAIARQKVLQNLYREFTRTDE